MSAGDVAAVVVAVAVAVAALGLVRAMTSLARTLGKVQVAVEDLHRQAVPLLTDLHATVRQANAELVRVDGLLQTAESIGGTADSASRLAYRAFSTPMVKAMSVASGAAGALRRLRGRGQGTG